MGAFSYTLCEQLMCSFLNPSDISSAGGGGGGSPVVPTVGRTLLPSLAGTEPRDTHPAPSRDGLPARLMNRQPVCSFTPRCQNLSS